MAGFSTARPGRHVEAAATVCAILGALLLQCLPSGFPVSVLLDRHSLFWPGLAESLFNFLFQPGPGLCAGLRLCAAGPVAVGQVSTKG